MAEREYTDDFYINVGCDLWYDGRNPFVVQNGAMKCIVWACALLIQ